MRVHALVCGRVVVFHAHVCRYSKAVEPKEVWIAPGADHCALLNVHPEEYGRRLLGFLEARHREYVEASVVGADVADGNDGDDDDDDDDDALDGEGEAEDDDER